MVDNLNDKCENAALSNANSNNTDSNFNNSGSNI